MKVDDIVNRLKINAGKFNAADLEMIENLITNIKKKPVKKALEAT